MTSALTQTTGRRLEEVPQEAGGLVRERCGGPLGEGNGDRPHRVRENDTCLSCSVRGSEPTRSAGLGCGPRSASDFVSLPWSFPPASRGSGCSGRCFLNPPGAAVEWNRMTSGRPASLGTGVGGWGGGPRACASPRRVCPEGDRGTARP